MRVERTSLDASRPSIKNERSASTPCNVATHHAAILPAVNNLAGEGSDTGRNLVTRKNGRVLRLRMRITNKRASFTNCACAFSITGRFTNCACALLINGRAFAKVSAEISEKSSGNQKSQRYFEVSYAKTARVGPLASGFKGQDYMKAVGRRMRLNFNTRPRPQTPPTKWEYGDVGGVWELETPVAYAFCGACCVAREPEIRRSRMEMSEELMETVARVCQHVQQLIL